MLGTPPPRSATRRAPTIACQRSMVTGLLAGANEGVITS